jgi:hypothetical protein
MMEGLRELTNTEIGQVSGGKITEGQQVNGGGNIPHGNANGVPKQPNTNPAGHAPPGQQ